MFVREGEWFFPRGGASAGGLRRRRGRRGRGRAPADGGDRARRLRGRRRGISGRRAREVGVERKRKRNARDARRRFFRDRDDAHKRPRRRDSRRAFRGRQAMAARFPREGDRGRAARRRPRAAAARPTLRGDLTDVGVFSFSAGSRAKTKQSRLLTPRDRSCDDRDGSAGRRRRRRFRSRFVQIRARASSAVAGDAERPRAHRAPGASARAVRGAQSRLRRLSGRAVPSDARARDGDVRRRTRNKRRRKRRRQKCREERKDDDRRVQLFLGGAVSRGFRRREKRFKPTSRLRVARGGVPAGLRVFKKSRRRVASCGVRVRRPGAFTTRDDRFVIAGAKKNNRRRALR